MELIATDLEAIISQYHPVLNSLDESRLAFKSSPSKWSKKEVIGHMIDSAQSNIRRFVVAQYEEDPTINYNQEKWVAIAGYLKWNSHELIDLWYLLNRQICEILKNTSSEAGQRQCMTQELHTIEWLAQDYIKHLKHHLHQVLELEPVAYP
jgi:UTP-glucose-1-phosphate uridylyltransferase